MNTRATLASSPTICAIFIAGMLAACGDNLTHPAEHPDYDGGDAQPLSCVPNLDGRIDPSELSPTLDTPVNYLVSPAGKERTVDLTGTIVSGQRVWNLAVDYADDARLKITASTVIGKWYATSFPGGQFVTPFDAGATLEAVYRKDDQALWLLGLASTTPDAAEGKTLLVYDTGIPIVRFPLVVGAKWVAAGTIVGGTLRGLPYAGKDVYEVEDDATGRLVLHDLTFEQAHRLKTKVTVSPAAGAPTSTRQVSFFVECFGEVARATSRLAEPSDLFTTTAELRRFGL
jgi:hypothetical protein